MWLHRVEYMDISSPSLPCVCKRLPPTDSNVTCMVVSPTLLFHRVEYMAISLPSPTLGFNLLTETGCYSKDDFFTGLLYTEFSIGHHPYSSLLSSPHISNLMKQDVSRRMVSPQPCLTELGVWNFH